VLQPEEQLRYSRHLLLPEVGEAGQRRLKEAGVLLIGAGGLGSPLALYLAAAGVGRLGLVDFDAVDLSNLQRQVLHGTSDVGRPKLDSARDRIREVNPHVQLDLYPVRLTRHNAKAICQSYDVVVDGTDNFATRYLVNDVAVLLGKPNVYGSIYRFEGQVSVFHPASGGPCYRCLYPEPPPAALAPSCAEAGVLGVLPGIVGTLQATECLKLLLGLGDALQGRLLLIDALRMRFQELKLARDPACRLCGDHPSLTELEPDYQAFCKLPTQDGLSPETLRAELMASQPPSLLDVREPWEWQQGHLPDAVLIPLNELERRWGELDTGADWVVYCKSGGRSARACALLSLQGFARVRNLAGGMDAWQQSP
jgi:sulfur-carrier protein adenylyltransferase/sulfurtransferase